MQHRYRGIYIHIPFCFSKCYYCDFTSYPVQSEKQLSAYVTALCKEIDRTVSGPVDTIFIGGGTPSLLNVAQVAAILYAIKQASALTPDAEISMEMNPGAMCSEKLAGYRQAGINRLSIGVQSTEDRNLELLGRCHTIKDARLLVEKVRKAGFSNVSCDIIYGLPGQCLTGFKQELEMISNWPVDHLSLYALSLEKGTKLSKQVQTGILAEPEEEDAALMYEWAQIKLEEKGFKQYEISNFSKPEKQCRHNLHYWNGEEYFGCGVAAHSHIDNWRLWNTEDITRYETVVTEGRSALEGKEKLEKKAKISERFILKLRLINGIDVSDFDGQMEKEWIDEKMSTIKKFESQHLLYYDGRFLKLTKKGMILSNLVFCELL